MRKALITGVAASALLLTSCATLTVDEQIAEVQKYATLICNFLPSISTVTQILAAGDPALGTSLAIGSAICAAVTNIGQAEGPTKAPPIVAGVVIKGHFVK